MPYVIGLVVIALCAIAWAVFHETNRTDDGEDLYDFDDTDDLDE